MVWKIEVKNNIREYLKGGNQALVDCRAIRYGYSSKCNYFYQLQGKLIMTDGFVQFYFGLPFAMVVICLFFIPIYHKLKVYTAYEYLETRFDIRVRTLTSILFLIQRGLAAGITIYAPAIIMSIVIGWDLKLMVVLVGGIVIFYTLIGGTKLLILHKQQMSVILIGIIIAFVYIIQLFPKEIFSDALEIAGKAGKLKVLDFSLDLNSRYTIWSGLTGGFFSSSYFGTDQSQVQRYLSGKSMKESQIGLIMNGILKIPLQFFILLIGVMVFVFYQFEYAPINFNPKAISA